ncbi:hypothetical protein SAMN05421820_115123 [Pedobacter steynii]|uniref:DUF3826 domain-containing protein n=1 Tax=Pedobacter steynii TaxID=430522 RepID=A0A1H0K038_9SPHI|nr:hypothetical protein [Pedobacter steynii]NQX43207.1 hypothetical protein [Pedobacter steynii]SDO49083.1 hypothetical protein SAMN05421820_115123 [Pedobacter steynii]
MKSTLITVILIFLLSGTMKAQSSSIAFKWTPENEKIVSREFRQHFKSSSLSAEEKRKLEDCLISKLKARYPNGVKTTNAAFLDLCEKIGIECKKMVKPNVLYPWSADNEKTLKKETLSMMPEGFSPSEKKAVSDCIVDKLKAQHPKGVYAGFFRSKAYSREIIKIADGCVIKHLDNKKAN